MVKLTSNPIWKVRVCCPFCEVRKGRKDTKYHLYISKDGVLHCFRCEFWGNVFDYPGLLDIYNSYYHSSASPLYQNKVNYALVKVDFKCFPDHYDYLRKRGLEDWVIQKYWFISYSFKNFVFTEQSCGYIGRNILNDEPRYIVLGSKGYLYLDAYKRETLWIVEGVFSAFLIYQDWNMSAISTLGKEVSKEILLQIKEIANEYRKVVISPDSDMAIKWMSIYFDFLTSALTNVEYKVFRGYKDVSEVILDLKRRVQP